MKDGIFKKEAKFMVGMYVLIPVIGIIAAIVIPRLKTFTLSEICIAREENNGVINIRPTEIIIDGRSVFSIVGGERKYQKVEAGEHSIVARSPNPLEPKDTNTKAWESKELKVTVPRRGRTIIAIFPKSLGAQYVGPWELKVITSN